jgi:hypothetical protein
MKPWQIPLQNRTGMSQQTLLLLKKYKQQSDDPFMQALAGGGFQGGIGKAIP